MRPVALGRKNWIHIGSPQAGPKVAAILSVVESCRRLKLPARHYWRQFSPGLPISRSSASQTLPLLYGSTSIHRLERPGRQRKAKKHLSEVILAKPLRPHVLDRCSFLNS